MAPVVALRYLDRRPTVGMIAGLPELLVSAGSEFTAAGKGAPARRCPIPPVHHFKVLYQGGLTLHQIQASNKPRLKMRWRTAPSTAERCEPFCVKICIGHGFISP